MCATKLDLKEFFICVRDGTKVLEVHFDKFSQIKRLWGFFELNFFFCVYLVLRAAVIFLFCFSSIFDCWSDGVLCQLWRFTQGVNSVVQIYDVDIIVFIDWLSAFFFFFVRSKLAGMKVMNGEYVDVKKINSSEAIWRQALNLIFCAGGTLLCYLWYGIIQESM